MGISGFKVIPVVLTGMILFLDDVREAKGLNLGRWCHQALLGKPAVKPGNRVFAAGVLDDRPFEMVTGRMPTSVAARSSELAAPGVSLPY
ncbi:hypothetical protein [Arthrobacter sp. RCC_34]|uniref:hypothetical protein n=1 Tax=Arthrobacter sp. RCC_34 TaxID=3239230 RepID=UPI003526C345